MIHEKFKRQLETNKVVTEESLLEMKNKTYHNGDEVKVGDKILFGMIEGEDESGNVNLTMIMLNENQIDLYELNERRQQLDTFLPIIKLK
jgi:co-chaperonin GroES (HSP10)